MSLQSRFITNLGNSGLVTFNGDVNGTVGAPGYNTWKFYVKASGGDIGKTIQGTITFGVNVQEVLTVLDGNEQLIADFAGGMSTGTAYDWLLTTEIGWILAVGELTGVDITCDQSEGFIPTGEIATIQWDGSIDCQLHIVRDGVADSVYYSGKQGSFLVQGADGESVNVTVAASPTVALPTHFQVSWYFDDEIDVDGYPTNILRGSIEPFVEGSVSTSSSQVVSGSTVAQNCGIRYFSADEVTPAGFRGMIEWEIDGTIVSNGQYGAVASTERFSTGHRVMSNAGRMVDAQASNPTNVFNFKITNLDADQPGDTVQPEAEEEITGGGGASWPEPDPEVEPPPEPTEPPPVGYPEGNGTKPEPTEGCECSIFFLYIGDWIQNVSINVWNLCQFVFQITQQIQIGFSGVIGTLQIFINGWFDKAGQFLAFLEDLVLAMGVLATKLGEIKDSIDALTAMIESKPPIDVTVQDDEVLVQGIEREEDLPETYFRRGIK